MRTKAASWAYFSGEEENAVRILMNSSSKLQTLITTDTRRGTPSARNYARRLPLANALKASIRFIVL
jgi:hypothetical protein